MAKEIDYTKVENGIYLDTLTVKPPKNVPGAERFINFCLKEFQYRYIGHSKILPLYESQYVTWFSRMLFRDSNGEMHCLPIDSKTDLNAKIDRSKTTGKVVFAW